MWGVDLWIVQKLWGAKPSVTICKKPTSAESRVCLLVTFYLLSNAVVEQTCEKALEIGACLLAHGDGTACADWAVMLGGCYQLIVCWLTCLPQCNFANKRPATVQSAASPVVSSPAHLGRTWKGHELMSAPTHAAAGNSPVSRTAFFQIFPCPTEG